MPIRAVLSVALLVGLASAVALAVEVPKTPTLAVDRADSDATWKEGWLRPGAAVRFAGRVGAPSTLTAVLRPIGRRGIVTARREYHVAHAGRFSEALSLPPRPLPGRYQLRV